MSFEVVVFGATFTMVAADGTEVAGEPLPVAALDDESAAPPEEALAEADGPDELVELEAPDELEEAPADAVDEDEALEAAVVALLGTEPALLEDWPQAARLRGRVRHAVAVAARRVRDDM